MAFDQISTSVTIINSGLSGFFGVSLTNYNTSALSAIESGSVIEIAGAFFKADSEIAINATSWSAITTATNGYIGLIPTGTAGSQTLTAEYYSSSPTWVASKQGWYASASSNVRIIGSIFKISATSQGIKQLYITKENTTFRKKINIGAYNIASGSTKSIYGSQYSIITKISNLSCEILDDSGLTLRNVNTANDSTNIKVGGYVLLDIANSAINIIPNATAGSMFYGNTSFDDSVINRGYISFDYEAI